MSRIAFQDDLWVANVDALGVVIGHRHRGVTEDHVHLWVERQDRPRKFDRNVARGYFEDHLGQIDGDPWESRTDVVARFLSWLDEFERDEEKKLKERRRATLGLRRTSHHKGYEEDPDAIQREVEKRCIDRVLHFTRIENLDRILRLGLLPVAKLDEREITRVINDPIRLDGHRNATSTSVTFPNYKYLSTIRFRTGGEGRSPEFAIIEIDPAVLWELPCAFYPTNAASADVRSRHISNFVGRAAFERLFNDGSISRAELARLGIGSAYPTDPQAEVMVFGEIGTKYFKSVVFETPEAAHRCLPDAKIARVDSTLFGPRADFRFWQNQVRY